MHLEKILVAILIFSIFVRGAAITVALSLKILALSPSSPVALEGSSDVNCFWTNAKETGGVLNFTSGANLPLTKFSNLSEIQKVPESSVLNCWNTDVKKSLNAFADSSGLTIGCLMRVWYASLVYLSGHANFSSFFYFHLCSEHKVSFLNLK